MQGDLFNSQRATRNAHQGDQSVECLGLTFEDDEAHNRVSRRELRVGG